MSNYPRFDTKLFSEIWERVDEFVYDYQTIGIPMTISISNANTLFYLLYARYGNNPIANYDEEQFKYKVFSIIWQYGPTWQKRLSVQESLRGLQLSDLIDDGSLHELFSHTGSENSSKTGSDGNTRTYQEAGTNTGTQAVAHTGTIRTQGDNEDIKNHAFNPGTAPAANAYSPLGYINEQTANKTDVDNTTTHNNTDTTTNNLADAKSGTITDSRQISDAVTGQEASNNETTRTLTQGKLKAYEKLLELLDSDVTGDFLSKFKVCFKQFVMPEMTWIYVTDLDEEEEEEEEDD
jgi:hypothetical protein